MSVGTQTTSIKEKSLKFEREHYLELLIRIRHLNQHIFFSENDVTLLRSWIVYHLDTVLDRVPPGFWRDALCMNNIRVKCACKVRHRDTLEILFKNKWIFCILLIVVFYILYSNQCATMCSSCIWKSVQPQCFDRKATNRNFLQPVYIPQRQ